MYSKTYIRAWALFMFDQQKNTKEVTRIITNRTGKRWFAKFREGDRSSGPPAQWTPSNPRSSILSASHGSQSRADKEYHTRHRALTYHLFRSMEQSLRNMQFNIQHVRKLVGDFLPPSQQRSMIKGSKNYEKDAKAQWLLMKEYCIVYYNIIVI